MYSEKTFKNYIFWIQVKRIVLIILLTCIGATLGVVISELCESIVETNAYNVAIIIGVTVFMFLLSLLLTTGTGKEVQDGYWKIAVLRKLTTIQKLIETNNHLLGSECYTLNKEEFNKNIDFSLQKNIYNSSVEETNDIEYEDDYLERKESDEDNKFDEVKEVKKDNEDNNKNDKSDKLNKVNKNKIKNNKKGKKKRKITKVKETV